MVSGTRAVNDRTFQPSPPPTSKTRPPLFIPKSSVEEPVQPIHPNTQVDPTELVRQNAEAAAALLETRDRRRAVKRQNQINQKKRLEMENIPVRGRPTYKRQSFSKSSGESRSGSPSSRSVSPSPNSGRGPTFHKTGSPQPFRPYHKTAGLPHQVSFKRGRYEHHLDRQQQQPRGEFGKGFNENYRRYGNNANMDNRDHYEFNRYGRYPESLRVPPATMNNVSRYRNTGNYIFNQFISKPVHSLKRPYNAGPGEIASKLRIF